MQDTTKTNTTAGAASAGPRFPEQVTGMHILARALKNIITVR
mgnify:CR=1 FL=1